MAYLKKFLFVYLVVLLAFSTTFGQDHPRVLLDAADIPAINTKINNQENEYSYLLYNRMKQYVSYFANHTNPGTNMQVYGRYAQVAFVAMLEDNDVWKDNMINLALLFNNNFSMVIEDESNMIGPIEAYGHNVSFYTVASALIYDFCYDRLDANQKSILISNVLDGLDVLRVDINNKGLFYKYNVGHANQDAAYILGAIAIVGDTPSYTVDDLNNDLNLIKTNLFDADYGMMNYMFGDEGSFIDGAGDVNNDGVNDIIISDPGLYGSAVSIYSGDTTLVVNTIKNKPILPEKFTFSAYPNPFNSTTTISYNLFYTSEIKLSIYNCSGQLIKLIKQGLQKPGFYSVEWKGKSEKNMQVGSGVYFIRLSVKSHSLPDQESAVQKLVLIK